MVNSNLDIKGYVTNSYRAKKLKNYFLVTADHGSFLFLNEKQHNLFRLGKIKQGTTLFNLLKEKGLILTNDNMNQVIEDFRQKNAFLFEGASLHIVIPTLRCNHRCVYCHASSKAQNAKGYDMDEETARKTVDFIFQSPSPYITIEFQGGEPLLNFEIVRYIVDYANELNKKHKKDLLFAIVTNLSLMDDEKLDYLIKNDVGICTSLDGRTELHNKNRISLCKADSYFFVSRGIKKIQQEYKKRKIKRARVGALITITKTSLKYPKEVVDEYVKFDLKDIHLRFLKNLGDARPVWSEISYSAEQFIDFWKKALDYILELNKKGTFIREQTAVIMLKKIFEKVDPGYLDLRSPCGAAIGQLTYNYNGDIYTCDEARMTGEDIFKIGDVKKNCYKDALTSSGVCAIVASSVNDVQACDSCVFKSYCGLCPVCNYAEQGSIIAKIPQTNRCKIFKAQFEYIFEKLHDNETKKIFLDWIKRP